MKGGENMGKVFERAYVYTDHLLWSIAGAVGIAIGYPIGKELYNRYIKEMIFGETAPAETTDEGISMEKVM